MPLKNKQKPTVEDMLRSPIGEVYTTDETARMLKCSIRSVLRAIDSKKLMARKHGKAFLITGDSIKSYWESLPKG